MSLQPPLPLLMLRVQATMLTFFMNEDWTSLMNFCRFVVPNEPNCLLCCVYGSDGDMCHPSQNCPFLLDGYQCFKCRILGRIAIIPFPIHLIIVPNATFCTMGKHWAMCHCMKESMVLIAWVRYEVNNIEFFFGPFGIATH